MDNYYEKMNNVYKCLADDESRFLFKARIDFMLNHDLDAFYDKLLQMKKVYRMAEAIEKRIDDDSFKGIILFGCGKDGKYSKRFLENCHKKVSFFCDNNVENIGQTIEGIPVISTEELLDKYKEYLIIITSRKYGKEIFTGLREKGVLEERIVVPPQPFLLLRGSTGRQYFDLFPAGTDEVFVDGGAYDGTTSIDFIEWANGKYKKIYVFEPLAEMKNEIEHRLEGYENIAYYGKALWDKKETICFSEDATGSSINGNGQVNIETTSIDSVIPASDKVTFIKMDIEGAELKALQGAAKTI